MKKIFLAVAVAAIAGVNVYKADMNKKQLSDLQLENIEKLALGEPFYECDGNPECICFHGAFPGQFKIGYMTSAGV